jgi:hypothetical protein
MILFIIYPQLAHFSLQDKKKNIYYLRYGEEARSMIDEAKMKERLAAELFDDAEMKVIMFPDY